MRAWDFSWRNGTFTIAVFTSKPVSASRLMAKKRSAKKKGRKPPPKCKAILLCDTIIVDGMTGKATIVGIFDEFDVPFFPGQTGPCNAFLQLTDGIGEYEITVEIHDLREDKVIARAQLAKMVFKKERPKVI